MGLRVLITSVGSWGKFVGGVIRLHGIWCIDHQCGIEGTVRGRCNKIPWDLVYSSPVGDRGDSSWEV